MVFRQVSQQGRDQLDQLDSGWFEVMLKESCCSWDGFYVVAMEIADLQETAILI